MNEILTYVSLGSAVLSFIVSIITIAKTLSKPFKEIDKRMEKVEDTCKDMQRTLEGIGSRIEEITTRETDYNRFLSLDQTRLNNHMQRLSKVDGDISSDPFDREYRGGK